MPSGGWVGGWQPHQAAWHKRWGLQHCYLVPGSLMGAATIPVNSLLRPLTPLTTCQGIEAPKPPNNEITSQYLKTPPCARQLDGGCHHSCEQPVELLLELSLAISWHLEVNLEAQKTYRKSQQQQQKSQQQQCGKVKRVGACLRRPCWGVVRCYQHTPPYPCP